jgi:hypothetical protein
MKEISQTLYTFAKICSDKNEEPTFNGNKEGIKNSLKKNLI